MQRKYSIKKNDVKFRKSFVCRECHITYHTDKHLSDEYCTGCFVKIAKKTMGAYMRVR
jgi:protein-arginine kinase activator protein McsA